MKNPELNLKKYSYRIRFKDKNGIIGSFIIDKKTGKQVTKTYRDSYDLFTSEEYKKLKLESNERTI